MDINFAAEEYAKGDSKLNDAFIAGFLYHGVFIERANSTKESKIKAKQKKFYDELVPYVGEYSREIVREFYDYWSESDRQMLKIRFEKEKTWELSKRLSRWAANNNGSNFKNNSKQESQSNQQTKTRIEIT